MKNQDLSGQFPLTAALVILLFFLVPLSASVGAADTGFGDAVKAIMIKAGWIDESLPSSVMLILFRIRLPRVFLAGISGAGLAVAGAVFQGIFRNPLAEPYLLGVSSGASFGATTALVLGAGSLAAGSGIVAVSAFGGSILAVFLVFAAAGKSFRNFSRLLLGGIAVGYIFQAVISLMMMLNRDQLDHIVYWTMGSFASAGWQDVAVCFPVVLVCSAYLIANAKKLNILSLGAGEAHSLGLNPGKTGAAMLLVSCLLTSAVVSVSGIIGFTGLIVPHMIRLVSGPDHRKLLPASAAGGACLMILADLAARTMLAPREIPVGVITAILGGPFFLFMLRNKKRVSE